MTKVGQTQYTIKIFDAAVGQCITPFAMMNYLQEAAWKNALELGFSVETLGERGLTWILYRLNMQLSYLPFPGETIVIKTWPAGFWKSFVFRDFSLHRQNGEPIGLAESSWLVLNVKTRRLSSLPDDLLAHSAAVGRPEKVIPALKIRNAPTGSLQQNFVPGWHDTDANGHTNNAVYLRWMVDSLPYTFLKGHRLAAADLQFKAELLPGEEIIAHAWPTEKQTWHHLLYRQKDGKEIMSGITQWTT